MKDEELQEIRERVNQATPGPWKSIHGDDLQFMTMVLVVPASLNKSEMTYCSRDEDEYDSSEVIASTLIQSPEYVGIKGAKWYENADFIAHTREDVPKLLDEIERLRSALKQYANFENWSQEIWLPDTFGFIVASQALGEDS